MDEDKTKEQELAQHASSATKQTTQSSAVDTRKPYQKPTLEIHSDSNLWAFGTLGG